MYQPAILEHIPQSAHLISAVVIYILGLFVFCSVLRFWRFFDKTSCATYLHVSVSFFHGIHNTSKDSVHLMKIFPLFLEVFSTEPFSERCSHRCLGIWNVVWNTNFHLINGSTKKSLTHGPDCIWKAADFGCKCVWDGLISYCWLVSLEDFAVVFFPSHQMHMQRSNNSFSTTEGMLPWQEQLFLVAQGSKGHYPRFKLLFFHFWRNWYLTHWDTSGGHSTAFNHPAIQAAYILHRISGKCKCCAHNLLL